MSSLDLVLRLWITSDLREAWGHILRQLALVHTHLANRRHNEMD